MWNIILSVWGILAGPLIGAIIGWGTNWVAVKMLFRPLTPKKMFGKRLPFTPGIIPKRQPALARTIGAAVGQKLLTADDIAAMLATDKVKNAVVDEICLALYAVPADLVADAAGDKLSERVRRLDIGNLIAQKGGEAIKSKVKGTMLSMFISEDTIRSIVTQLGTQIEDYVRQNSTSLIRAVITGNLPESFSASLPQSPEASEGAGESSFQSCPEKSDMGVLSAVGISEDAVRSAVVTCYDSFVEHKVHAVTDHLDVAGTVESKIAAMSPRDLEVLVLSVMKKELNAIVWLGAVLGFLLGLLTLLR